MSANIGVWMVSLFGGFLMERLTRLPVLVSLATDMSPLAGMVAVVFAGIAYLIVVSSITGWMP